jgi:cyclase
MKKIIIGTALGLAVIAGSLALYLNNELQQFEVTPVTDDLFMISGDFGGNVGVLRTGAGAVVVDTMTFALQGERIRELAQELTGEEVVAIINTHYHLDHTHGNPGFKPGTRVVATQRTLAHLQRTDADYFSGGAAQFLPGETFTGEHTLRIGEKTMRLIHPGSGHTDGDLVVLFVEDQALHSGDLFFNRHYPNIDLEAGGSVVAWGESLEPLFELPYQQIIPGHGELSDKAGLRQFQEFIRELAEVGAYAASINGSLKDTQVNGRLTTDAGYEPVSFGPMILLDREFVLRRTWEEATGNFERYDVH